MNKNGLAPKVLVEVSMVSLLGGWNTEVGTSSESREAAPAITHTYYDLL